MFIKLTTQTNHPDAGFEGKNVIAINVNSITQFTFKDEKYMDCIQEEEILIIKTEKRVFKYTGEEAREIYRLIEKAIGETVNGIIFDDDIPF